MCVPNEPGRAAEFRQQEMYSLVPSFYEIKTTPVFLLIEKGGGGVGTEERDEEGNAGNK